MMILTEMKEILKMMEMYSKVNNTDQYFSYFISMDVYSFVI